MTENNMNTDNAIFCRDIWSSFTDTLGKIYNEKVFDNHEDYQKMQTLINDLQQFFTSLSDDFIKEATNKFFNLLFQNIDYSIIGVQSTPSPKFQMDTVNFADMKLSRQTGASDNCDCSCHDGTDNKHPEVGEKSFLWSAVQAGGNLAGWVSELFDAKLLSHFFSTFNGVFGDAVDFDDRLADVKKAINEGAIGKNDQELDELLGVIKDPSKLDKDNPYTNNGTPPGSSSGCKPDCDCDCHDDKPNPTKPQGPGTPQKLDPLVLDLNHNGVIDTTNINSGGVYFDVDGIDGGIRERMGWVGEGDGFLVQDKDGNGKIDGIGELFGNSTTNAFDDLRARIDSNGDGKIDSWVGLI